MFQKLQKKRKLCLSYNLLSTQIAHYLLIKWITFITQVDIISYSEKSFNTITFTNCENRKTHYAKCMSMKTFLLNHFFALKLCEVKKKVFIITNVKGVKAIR